MTGVSVNWTTTTASADETRGLARQLAQCAEAGDVLWLSGDLGAGKTTFTQGLGQGLGITVPVVSPTFVLIREYAGRLALKHIDLYRLENARDISNLGLGDYLEGGGICVIEWAERMAGAEQQAGLHVRIEIEGESTRELRFTAAGERAGRLLDCLRNEEKSHAARN